MSLSRSGRSSASGRNELGTKTTSTPAARSPWSCSRIWSRPAWGVLFEVPDELLSRATSGSGRSFDEIEGEGTNYRRSWLPVRDRNGQLLIALTYVVVCPRENLRTSEAYVGHILKGLRDHDVPQN